MQLQQALTAFAVVAFASQAPTLAQCPNTVTGPDVIVGDIPSLGNFGATAVSYTHLTLPTIYTV